MLLGRNSLDPLIHFTNLREIFVKSPQIPENFFPRLPALDTSVPNPKKCFCGAWNLIQTVVDSRRHRLEHTFMCGLLRADVNRFGPR
jgi:hypothetical protein